MATETRNVCYTSPPSAISILGHTFKYFDCSYSGGRWADIIIDDVSVRFSSIPKTIAFTWGSVVLNDCVTCDLGFRGASITVNVNAACIPVCNFVTE